MTRASRSKAERQEEDIPAVLRKSQRPSYPERWGYKTLKETSQGGVFDLAPEHWIEDELYKHDAKRETAMLKHHSSADS